MIMKCYFLQCTGEQNGVYDLVHTYPGIDGKLIECFQVDYSLNDTESDYNDLSTEFMFNLEGYYHWNGYSLKKVTNPEKIREYQFILNSMGKTFIVE